MSTKHIALIAATSPLVIACAGYGDHGEEGAVVTVNQPIKYGHEVPQPVPYPGLVNVHWSADGHNAGCGGVLISPTRVLTANHCVDSTEVVNGVEIKVQPIPANFHVYVNRYHFNPFNVNASNEGQVRQVVQIIPHPAYIQPYKNDIAILVLATPARAVAATLLSPQAFTGVPVGASVDVVGWGDTETGRTTTPHAATVNLRGVGSGCNGLKTVSISGTTSTVYGTVPEFSLCLGTNPASACAWSGDSGGPAYLVKDNQWQVLGVDSYGSGGGILDYYSSVPYYYDWILANTPDLNSTVRGFMIKSDANPSLAVSPLGSGGTVEGAFLGLTGNCDATNPNCTWSYQNGMIVNDFDPTLAVNAWGGAQFGTQLLLTRSCAQSNPDCTWTYQSGEFLSDANPALKINAYGGAQEGTLLKLHSGCTNVNPDCTWEMPHVMLTSVTDPTMAINAFGGAHFGTDLRLHNGCSTANRDCTWTFTKGMILSDTEPALAVNAFGGAADNGRVALHNGCSTINSDCTWTWSRGYLVSDTHALLTVTAVGGATFGAYLKLTNSSFDGEAGRVYAGLSAGR
jgi:hypothetical protein